MNLIQTFTCVRPVIQKATRVKGFFTYHIMKGAGYLDISGNFLTYMVAYMETNQTLQVVEFLSVLSRTKSFHGTPQY